MAVRRARMMDRLTPVVNPLYWFAVGDFMIAAATDASSAAVAIQPESTA